MKLFLLQDPDYEGVTIYGLYSTKEKAIESLPYREQQLDESNIEEIEVDPPNEGGQCELFYCVAAYTDGCFWENKVPLRKKNDDADLTSPTMSWDQNKDIGCVYAYGRTMEEAKAKAVEGLKLLDPVWQVGRAINSDSLIVVHHPHPSRIHAWPQPYAVHQDLNMARHLFLKMEAKA